MASEHVHRQQVDGEHPAPLARLAGAGKRLGPFRLQGMSIPGSSGRFRSTRSLLLAVMGMLRDPDIVSKKVVPLFEA